MLKRLPTALAALVVAGSFGTASAQEVTLKGISSFAEKTFYSRGFERFIDKVNADGKGVIQINYIGGPKAMPRNLRVNLRVTHSATSVHGFGAYEQEDERRQKIAV